MSSNRIFVVGAGRSGTTVFFDILSRHAEMSWLVKKVVNRYPTRPEKNRRLMRLMHKPVIGKIVRRMYEPGECYPFWDKMYPGFANSYRDLLASDVSERARKRIKQSLSAVVASPEDKLVMKITGWNRMGFLNEVFPEAKFIHVSRDSRAVMNSNINVYFWRGWRGPHHFLEDGFDAQAREELERFDGSFVALAGMRMLAVQQSYLQAAAAIPDDRLMKVSYEQLCEDPMALYEQVCDWLGIEWSQSFQQIVRQQNLVNTNFKWQQDLSEEQQKIAQYYHDKVESLG